jgi:uncharacterized membrane protein
LSENFSSWGRNLIDSKAIIVKSAILAAPALLGIIGASYVNQPILLLMTIMIATLYALSMFSNRFSLSKSYSMVIFAIAIALAYSLLLTSKYILGYDVQVEYYVFRTTSINGYWHFLPAGINLEGTVRLNAMLSVTILPTIYSALLNTNGEAVFKTLYPFVFSLVPVTLYRIYARQIGKSASLLSALFFVSSLVVFYGVEPLSVNRQIVAEFFLVLSIFILLDKKISIGKRRLLLIVFGAALVVSHYSTMYIYLFLVFSIYAIAKIKGRSDEVLNGALVALFFTMTFLWYSLSVAPLTSFIHFFNEMFSRFSTDLFNPAARSSQILATHPILTYASIINWVLFYTVHFFILIGILVLLFKPAKTTLDPKSRTTTILGAIILFLCFAVPNIAPALNLQRFYAITLLFVAPCFVLGAETLVGISKYVLKRATSRSILSNTHNQISTVLLCAVLIGYFLSQSGFINCVTGAAPQSYSLDYNRIRTSTDPNALNIISFYNTYIPEQDVFSATWLSKNKGELSMIYADYFSMCGVLTSYGLIPRQQIISLTNITMLKQGGFIYLGQLNIVNGIMTTFSAQFNTSDIYSLLNGNNLVYSNGNSEVWFVSSPG